MDEHGDGAPPTGNAVKESRGWFSLHVAVRSANERLYVAVRSTYERIFAERKATYLPTV